MHILVLQHEEIEHLGVFKAFLEQDGATWQVVELDKGERSGARFFPMA